MSKSPEISVIEVDPTIIRQIQLRGAEQYRRDEAIYSEMMTQVFDISEEPQVYLNITDHEADAYTATVIASFAQRKMDVTREAFSLHIGGQDNSLLVGMEHAFDPAKHEVGHYAGEEPLEAGEPAVIIKSQISRILPEGEDVLLPAVFRRADSFVTITQDPGDELPPEMFQPLAKSSMEVLSGEVSLSDQKKTT